MTDRRDQTVLTTGANSGIGLATVIEVARRGYRAVGTVRTQEKADAVAAAARAAGVEVETAILDVTHAADVEQLVDQHRPYGLVNNAGYSITGAIEDVPDDEARAALETMVLAPMRMARLAIPHMRERGEGRIVNVSSIYGRVTTPLTGWYQGTKHALEALTDALRMEVAGSGIRVVVVEPGGFRTGIWEETERQIDKRAGSRFDSAYRRTLQSTRLAQPIMGDPGQVARVIAGALSGFTRPRYLVGYDAAAIALWSRLTPTEIKDRLQRLVLGL
jgi:NAD(P)-dependent dehydrogenase (short-subunit alcohol dehydrogenase family)